MRSPSGHRRRPTGGIVVAHRVAVLSGLVSGIDQRLRVLKTHRPYHEPDQARAGRPDASLPAPLRRLRRTSTPRSPEARTGHSLLAMSQSTIAIFCQFFLAPIVAMGYGYDLKQGGGK